jgi:ribosomal protein S18 acetylase RimI-like enzyme
MTEHGEKLCAEMERFECQKLKEEDLPRAGDLCARAFLNSRAYVDIYGGTEEWRLCELTFLFERNLQMIYQTQPESLHGGYDLTDPNTPKLVCFFMFPRSNIPSASLWQKISVGLLWIPFRCGFNTFGRLMSISAHFDQIFQELLPGTHYELQRMVVDPAYQGQGIGSKCLKKALDEADAEGLPVILSTQEQINVRFYQKLGFEISLEEKYSSSGQAEDMYDNWIMIRQPKPMMGHS